jgi:hypothetical protein
LASYYTKSARLIIRPYQASDYQTWLSAYINRWPKQHEYDEGLLRSPANINSSSMKIKHMFSVYSG